MWAYKLIVFGSDLRLVRVRIHFELAEHAVRDAETPLSAGCQPATRAMQNVIVCSFSAQGPNNYFQRGNIASCPRAQAASPWTAFAFTACGAGN